MRAVTPENRDNLWTRTDVASTNEKPGAHANGGMKGSILGLNTGSSSVKFALFDAADYLTATVRGEIENLDSTPHMTARDVAGKVLAEKHLPEGFDLSLHAVLDFADQNLGRGGLAAVGHRVVHGGVDHVEPEMITPALLAALEALTPLDPLHMPLNLAAMRAVAAGRPALRQVACYDTAFHHTMPLVAQGLALPRSLAAQGVRRYGFHGLSYEYIAGRLTHQSQAFAPGRVIVAHLGSGASLCALKGGKSVDTTMGFSALDGLVIATRCGLLDPGVILHLGRQGHSFADIEGMLYHRSGLLGVSAISGDVRVLLASDSPHAREALELFTYRVATEAGALISALGGLDGLIFTAGIGENAPGIRLAICERLAWFGLRLDDAANAANADRISSPDSTIEIRVIPTDEEAMIAHHTRATIMAADTTQERRS
jgi:acetate kinase